MLQRLCQFAPLAALVLLIACSESHGGATCNCCGVIVDVLPGETCFMGVCDPHCGIRVTPDGGTGPACATFTASPIALSCVSHVNAGRPTELGVAIGGSDACFCGEEVTCEVRIESPGVLALETGTCAGAALCEACFPFVEGTCSIPALSEGTWRVRVNGADAMELDVLPPDVAPERGMVCTRSADDGGTCGNLFPPREYTPSRACHPDAAYVGERVPIRVVDPCGGCGSLSGPCAVSVFDDVVVVRPRAVPSGCDVGCPAVCTEREDVCWTPPLEAGTWRVVVEGLVTTDAGPPTTISVGAPRPVAEICAGEPAP